LLHEERQSDDKVKYRDHSARGIECVTVRSVAASNVCR